MTPEQLEEFDGIAYAYRCIHPSDPQAVVAAFQKLVDFVDQLCESERVAEQESLEAHAREYG